jgi:AraC family transcriptional regulator
MCEPHTQPPGVAELQHDRDRWITINTIWDMVSGHELGRQVHHHFETNAIGLLLEVAPRAPNVWSQEEFVAALSHALNEAISGYPRRLEQFLSSDPMIEQLLIARSAANEMEREPARLYLRCLYAAILTWAAAHETIKWPLRPQAVMPLAKWRFARVKKYIDSHIKEPIHLQDLATAAGLSRMHFAAQFREYTGLSPGTFVMMHRIHHAKLLLGDPLRTVADVAFSVGFRTQAHFTTVFHRFVGNPPNCWRKRGLMRKPRRLC